jgi:hypothetical protein
MADNIPVSIDIDVIREMPQCIMVSDGTHRSWVPRSQIMDYVETGSRITGLIVPEWLAIKAGFV